MSGTICWTCRRGTRSECPWFAEHRPVPGWTAERREIRMTAYADGKRYERPTESYVVRKCPLYQKDPPRKKQEDLTGLYYDATICQKCYSRNICMKQNAVCNERARMG